MEIDKLNRLEEVIKEVNPDVTYVLGDTFDRNVVGEWYKVRLIEIINNNSCEFYFLRGNHDSKSSDFTKLCSLQLVGKLSKAYVVFDEPALINNNYFLGHCFNQSEFDSQLDAVKGSSLFLHCNVDNYFATESELSLNINKEQIDKALNTVNQIVVGHEHSHKRMYDDRLVILGAFQPTNISDCQTDKYVMVKEDGKTEFIKVWDRAEQYIKVPWTEVDTIGNQTIIEVTGEVSIADSVEAAKVVANLRKKSNAYIVKNSVKVINADLSVDKEDITNFNIVDIFKKALPKGTDVIVEEIINELSEKA